jgi:hypothetical protein
MTAAMASRFRSRAQTWAEWQREVLAILRRDLREALDQISLEDVDWPAWFHFYLEGRTASAAVDRALERDLRGITASSPGWD